MRYTRFIYLSLGWLSHLILPHHLSPTLASTETITVNVSMFGPHHPLCLSPATIQRRPSFIQIQGRKRLSNNVQRRPLSVLARLLTSHTVDNPLFKFTAGTTSTDIETDIQLQCSQPASQQEHTTLAFKHCAPGTTKNSVKMSAHISRDTLEFTTSNELNMI